MSIQLRRTHLYCSAALILLAGSAFAQEPHRKGHHHDHTVAPSPRSRQRSPADSITEGSVTVGGKTIAYKAVAGLLRVGAHGPSGRHHRPRRHDPARLRREILPSPATSPPPRPCSTPPTLPRTRTSRTRPIVFIYNGGPGSATMYLRMASFGPVRVVLPDLGHPAGGPYKIVPNEDSLLDTADLVFIDAPGTGYSRVMGKDAYKSFYGIDQDAGAFQRFIRRFLTKYDRWDSPRFLFGESYGTTRDAVLAAALQRHGVDLNGVVFLSPDPQLRRLRRRLRRQPRHRERLLPRAAQLRRHRVVSTTRCPTSPPSCCPGCMRSSSTRSASTPARYCRVPTLTPRRRPRSPPSSKATPAFPLRSGSRPTCASPAASLPRTCSAAPAKPPAVSTRAGRVPA